MEPLNDDDRLEYAIRHPKLFRADARDGQFRRIISTVLFLMGALFVLGYGAWFANMRETAAESSGQIAPARSHADTPATGSTVYLRGQSAYFQPATVSMDAPQGHIYKCVGKSGDTTFQQFPCPAGSTTGKVIAYVPRYEAVQPKQLPAVTVPAQPAQYTTYAVPPTNSSPSAECMAAQNYADERRRELGINAGVEVLRGLHDYVYEHCKHSG
jgi:hypothetical protein